MYAMGQIDEHGPVLKLFTQTGSTAADWGNAGTRRAPSELARIVQWVHAEETGGELVTRVRELAADMQQGRRPIAAASVGLEGEILAACYFRQLPGRVGDLAGLRIAKARTPAGESTVRQLMAHCESELVDRGIAQIQAVVPDTDWNTREWLEIVGFECVAKVERRVVHLSPVAGSSNRGALIDNLAVTRSTVEDMEFPRSRTAHDHRRDRFVRAATFSERDLVQLLSQTFEGTLDCPLLNALRKPEDFLASFLDGAALDGTLPWWIYLRDEEPAGCVLLKNHAEQITELAYMGLVPECRGQGRGHLLVDHAIDQTRRMGGSALVAAVDANNAPAVRTYARSGLHVLDTMVVLFPRRTVQRHRKSA
ncbi:MAG: GNAT family N-acetyltransferase [Planctomycetota bacterium]|nr:MAG: GNAT family N-acetyltransferase [Planctomycetota bacterium]